MHALEGAMAPLEGQAADASTRVVTEGESEAVGRHRRVDITVEGAALDCDDARHRINGHIAHLRWVGDQVGQRVGGEVSGEVGASQQNNVVPPWPFPLPSPRPSPPPTQRGITSPP